MFSLVGLFCFINLYLSSSLQHASLWRIAFESHGLDKTWQSTPVFFPGEYHGWRSLVGYSPQDCKELDMTERLQFLFFSF